MNKFKRFIATLIVAFFFAPMVVQASVESANGIDISNYQNINDYQGLKDSGIEYCYIKCSEGTGYTDTKLQTHYDGCKSANIKVGFYHFFSEWSEPVDQAEYAYNSVKSLNNDLYFVLDVETNSRFFSQEQLSRRVMEFAIRFKQLSGQNIIIYSGSYFSRTYFNAAVIENYPLWVAHYYVDKPTIPDNATLVGHQFTDHYFVDNQYVDGNVFTDAVELNSSDTKTIDKWVVRLQRLINAAQDGIPGPITLSKCPLVKINSTGDTVKLLQERLKTFGYNCGAIDGYFGNNTREAVLAFQINNGLVADGVVGQNTWRKLLGL